eukprot:2378253-Prymnesium_polylepis.3
MRAGCSSTCRWIAVRREATSCQGHQTGSSLFAGAGAFREARWRRNSHASGQLQGRCWAGGGK